MNTQEGKQLQVQNITWFWVNVIVLARPDITITVDWAQNTNLLTYYSSSREYERVYHTPDQLLQ